MKILSSTSASNYLTVNKQLNGISIYSITIYGNHTQSHLIQNKSELNRRSLSVFLFTSIVSVSLCDQPKEFSGILPTRLEAKTVLNKIELPGISRTKEKFDTIVFSKIIPAEFSGSDYTEKEYFMVINKKDTSGFSCVISKSKINGNLSIRCSFNPYYKTPDSCSLGDSAAVTENKYEKSKLYYTPKYEASIKELKFILKEAAKEFDLSNLKSFSFSMLTFKGFSQSITKQYISLFGQQFGDNSNKHMADLIRKSTLVIDLNRILLPYSVMINKIFLDGLLYYAPGDTEGDSERIIDGQVIFSLVSFLHQQGMT